jgi:Phage integrase, N-terminal SAM-like domain
MTDEAMSPLRRRMIEDMTIRKLAPKTQQGYVRTIKDFAAFVGRSPDTASFEDVRRFQLHLASNGAHTARFPPLEVFRRRPQPGVADARDGPASENLHILDRGGRGRMSTHFRLAPKADVNSRCSELSRGAKSASRAIPGEFHSALIPAALMIGHHLSISAFWKAWSASGVCWSRGGIS